MADLSGLVTSVFTTLGGFSGQAMTILAIAVIFGLLLAAAAWANSQ